MNILTLLGVLPLVYFGWAVGYQLFFALAGHLRRLPPRLREERERRWAVLIPAYREDAVIVPVARSARQQDYPAAAYEVIVIADSLRPATLERLRGLPIRVIEVQFERSTKSKALHRTLEQLPADAYDGVVLLDADNEMAPDFLRRMNDAFNRGRRMVQGQRVPKNLDSPLAVLDGASESINNHILCAGHRAVGLSARLAGSGMAFDYALFREVMPQVDAIGGFDKELELRLTQRREFLAYDAGAFVYDEKVCDTEVFSNQRSRWIAAQFHYGRRFFGPALRDLLRRGNVDFFNKALQMWLPPRLLTPGILAGAALLSLAAGASSFAAAWALLLTANLLAFALGMPRYLLREPHRRALWQLPAAFLAALRSLLHLRRANRQFIHTPHGTADGRRQMADGRWQTSDGRRQTADENTVGKGLGGENGGA